MRDAAHSGSQIVAPDDEGFYGTFPGQQILGHHCDIVVEKAADNDPEIPDLLGVAHVMRGDSAVHVSGCDPFGRTTGPGLVRALGRVRVVWHDARVAAMPPYVLGSHVPEAAIIVSWDGDESGMGHRDGSWEDCSFYGRANGFLTLRGVYQWWRERQFGVFSVRDLAEGIDARHLMPFRVATEAQHERAFRRLLEGHVGVTNTRLPREHGQPVLRRVGRWGYTFAGVDHGCA